MCVGNLLLILALLCGIVAYPTKPNAQLHMPHVNRNWTDLDQAHPSSICNDDFSQYWYQHARERIPQQEHHFITHYDNKDENDDNHPWFVSVLRFLYPKYKVKDDEHQGFGRREDSISISINHPIDVLRQRLKHIEERKKYKEHLDRIEANKKLLEAVGKRSIRQEAPPEICNEGSTACLRLQLSSKYR